MKKLLSLLGLLTVFALIMISCEKDEEASFEKNSSDRINKNFSNKASRKAAEAEVIDFKEYINTEESNFTHLLYGNTYVLKNELGTSYSTGIVPLGEEFYEGVKSYYENLVVIEDNEDNANGFIMRYDMDTDEPIGWEPVFGYILSNPCLPMATSRDVPCNCSGSHSCDQISQCCCGEPGCESGHKPLCNDGGGFSIPCAKFYTEDGSVGVVGGGGGGGGGGGSPSPENNPINMPSGEGYPSGMVTVPFTQVPEVKVIDELTEMKIETIVAITDADETVKDWLINNNQKSGIVEIVDNCFDMVLSPFVTGELKDVLLELLIYLIEDNTALKNENTLAITEFLEMNKENGQIPLTVMEKIKEFLKITQEIPDARFDRFIEINDLVEQNPWVLIQDCAQQNGMDTQDYIDLYEHDLPQECSDRLFNLGSTQYSHQPITDGNVPLANIDYYGVEVSTNPDFNNDGTQDSEAEMYQAFREKFTDLASGEKDDFQFSCDIPGNATNTGDIEWEFIPFSTQDGLDFVSSGPIASILLIEADASGVLPTIATDDGAIIVSDFTNNDWTISTITTANNGTQPFSGNRQWGWIINEYGNFEFYTRAVDAANISKLLNVLSLGGATTECQQDTYYDIAEATWQNMQDEIAEWVNNHGGQATVIPSTAVRVDKEKIEELLTSNETIDEINCD